MILAGLAAAVIGAAVPSAHTPPQAATPARSQVATPPVKTENYGDPEIEARAPLGLVAQDDPAVSEQPAQATQIEDVVVVGRSARARAAVADFVSGVSASEGRRGQIGRFERRVCSGVVGMRPDYAQVLNDRIARVALALELRVGEPGCKPNILVIAAPDANQINALIDAAPNTFESYANTIERGDNAMRAVRAPRPVRWWHQVEFVETGERSSRLRAAGRTDIRRALVLLDMQQIGAVNFGALSDYVAMVSLARLNPEADVTGQTTILNLFQDPDTRRDNQGLTQWDADYLEGVYGSPRYAAVRRQQESDIVWQMLRRAPLASQQSGASAPDSPRPESLTPRASPSSP